MGQHQRISLADFTMRLDASVGCLSRQAARVWGDTRAPDIVVEVGTGMESCLASKCVDGTELHKLPPLPYADVTGFPFPSNAAGNAVAESPQVRLAEIGGKRVVFLTQRMQVSDGFSPHDVVHPLRTMLRWGVKQVILVSSCGALCHDRELRPGTAVLIKDHFTLFCGDQNPLRGFEHTKQWPVHLGMTEPYASKMRKIAVVAHGKIDADLRKVMPLQESGMLVAVPGPTFESAHERAALRQFGSIVGTSLWNGAIAARHMGCHELFAIALVSGNSGETRTRDDVKQKAHVAHAALSAWLIETITRLPRPEDMIVAAA